jgi:hypothetical protein
MDVSQPCRRVATIAALAVTAALAAQPAWAAVDKCGAAIEKNAGKLQATILKAIVKCVDTYQKNVVKAADPAAKTAAIQAAATACQAGLANVTNASSPASAIGKTRAVLDGLTNPAKLTCGDADLVNLGHVPTVVGGNHWSGLVILSAVKEAFATENTEVGIFPKAMIDMAGAATPCGECAKLAAPPCQTHACVLGPSTGASVILFGAPGSVSLTGVQLFDFCEFPGVLTNEIGVVGTSPARNFKSATVLGQNVCSSTLRTSTVVNCAGGTMPTVSIQTCQDSNLTDANECPAPSATNFCQPDDTVHNTGGACVGLTTSAAAPGQVFGLATSTIRLSSGNGPDGIPCTPDDPYSAPPAPSTIPITSATASGTVLDYNNTLGNNVSSAPITGVAGPSCDQLRSSNISTGKLVTSFPSADVTGSPLGDTITSLTLVCS